MKKIYEKIKHPYFIWSIIIIAVFIFFLAGISHESLWCDEAFSAMMVKYDFFNILKNTTKDIHPPLYYLILKTFTLVFGHSEWALRLLSVLGATGMVALGAGPVRKLFGDKTAYIYAAATIFTPIIIIMAHEARMYSLAMFTVTVSSIYGLLILKESKISYWIIFGISVLASAYLHYYALIAVFLINFFMLIWIIIKKRELIISFIIMAITVVLAYIPWLFFFIGQIKKVDNDFWIRHVQPTTFYTSLLQYFTYKNFFPKGIVTDTIGPIILLIVLISIITSIVYMIIKKEKQKLGMMLFLFSSCIGTLLVARLISLFLTPIVYHRYMTVCTGLLILAFCIAVGSFKYRAINVSIISLFVLLNLTAVININIQRFNGPFYDIENKFGKKIKSGDLIITSDCYCVSPALYYFSQADHYFYVNRYEKNWEFTFDALRTNFIKLENTNEIHIKYKSVWVIKNTIGLSENEKYIFTDISKWKEVDRGYFTYPCSEIGFTVSKYEYIGNNSNRNHYKPN